MSGNSKAQQSKLEAIGRKASRLAKRFESIADMAPDEETDAE